MQKYSYKALSSDGKVHRGIIAATDEDDFNKVVADKGLRVFWVKVYGKKEASSVKKLDLVMVMTFCRQLSSMLTAGLPLSKSLEMLYERTDKPKLKNALAALFEGVQKGQSLAESMAEMGNAFPPLLISMIKAGEMSGQLEDTLTKMADHYEKQKKQASQVKSATSYPKMLGIVLVLVTVAMIKFILPRMVDVLPEGTAVPGPTKVLMALDSFLTNNFVIIIALVFGIFIVLPIVRKIEAVDLFLGRLKIYLPIVGKLRRQIYTSTFASSLYTLSSNGVPLLDAMNMCSEMMGNSFISLQLDGAIEAIRRGESISASLQSIEAFDPLLMTMIFVGEESGSLDLILKQTAEYFENEASEAIKGMTSLINPLMTLVMAVVIGFVLIAILMPMFSLYDSY